ncbi:MAG: LLM class flavin-dependent oxidoreductase [Acidimicrobiaceae bacterium]|nr:LLM class flavin-dependent oxidoreductase [Acidimicrobiaceae bacterium]
MRFGYFLNSNNLGLRKTFTQVLNEGREVAKFCDQHGWHSIWTTEHHFGHEGLEVCPNPVLMCADLAAHTEKLRIGQAASIITFRNPLQVAEDVAMLDHMSGGRVEFDVGRGIYPRETLNMNPIADVRNPAVNRELFAEGLEVIRRAWTEEFFSYSGEHFEYPYPGVSFPHPMSTPLPENTDPDTGDITALALVPRPLQDPHPPIWQVVDTTPSIISAAQMGLKVMFWIPPTDSLVPRFELYRDTASEAAGKEIPLGSGVAVLRDMCVTETMKEAEELAGEALLRYVRWVCHYRGLENHRYPGEELPETDNKLDLLSYDWVHPRNLLFGTPEYVTEKIQEMKDKLNLQDLLVWSSFPGMQHEAAMASIELFTEQVMPQFIEDDSVEDDGVDDLKGVA